MSAPEPLASALAGMPDDPRFELVEGWVDRSGGTWSFRFRARLSVPASTDMPEWSEWHLVVEEDGPALDIHIHPDAEAGIKVQFPHQTHNLEGADGAAWRTGAPCLERPVSAFKREGWSGEPTDFAERVDWHIGRLLAWIDAAAQDRLIEEGDPIELPVLPLSVPTAMLGFSEDREDLQWWNEGDRRWGFATLAGIRGSVGATAIVDFMDLRRVSIRKAAWGKGISATPGRVDAVWMVMPSLVVGRPWRLPRTWEELSDFCSEVSVDLPGIMAEAGAALRHLERPKRAVPATLLVGFPMAETRGAPPERMHWLAVGNMRTARRADVRRGLSDRAGARRDWDRALAAEKRSLAYIPSSNWAPDQLRRRGEAEADARSRSVLLLGAGALGGAIADNLVRMGVRRLGIVDADTIAIGNLSRHVLTLGDLGWNKAEALAAKLNGTMPDADVTHYPFAFPPRDRVERGELRGWDVIVDCTAEDRVLRAMADYPWDGVKVFVSLSMTWRARGLFAYADEQASFPAVDAMQRFADTSDRPEDETLGLMEGIGCWHPVFPATADDVQLWAAVGTKFIRRAVVERRRMCEIFVQDGSGAVERRAA